MQWKLPHVDSPDNANVRSRRAGTAKRRVREFPVSVSVYVGRSVKSRGHGRRCRRVCCLRPSSDRRRVSRRTASDARQRSFHLYIVTAKHHPSYLKSHPQMS